MMDASNGIKPRTRSGATFGEDTREDRSMAFAVSQKKFYMEDRVESSLT